MTEQEKQADAANTDSTEQAKETKPEKDTKPVKKKAPPTRAKPRRAARYLLLILLLVLAGGGVAGYYGLQYYRQLVARLDTLSGQQSQLQQDNADLKSQLEGDLQTLSKQQADLASSLHNLRSQDQFMRKGWLVMEAKYLLQLANYRLLFARDVKTAIVALKTADDRLRETGDPGLIDVRKAIAESEQALKAVPQVDVAGMSLSMSALAKTISDLPLNTPEPRVKIEQQQSKKSAIRQVKTWSQLPSAVWQDLKSLIVIRHHDKPVEPLLPPDERFFLIENLRLQIEQARLAMLMGHAGVFKNRISTAISWIKKYFDPDAAQTQAALSTLQTLQQTNIAPSLPDITKPYHLLEAYSKHAKTSATESKQAGH